MLLILKYLQKLSWADGLNKFDTTHQTDNFILFDKKYDIFNSFLHLFIWNELFKCKSYVWNPNSPAYFPVGSYKYI